MISTPGGLIRQTRGLIDKVKSIYGIPCMLIGDTCYGICDTVDGDIERLDADLAFNIGHNATVESVGSYTYFIEAKDDVKFDSVVEKAIPIMRGYRRLGLATFSQHLDELQPVKNRLEEAGFDSYDAIHLSSAEFGKADVFLTTDDKILKVAARKKIMLSFTVENPVKWLEEVLK